MLQGKGPVPEAPQRQGVSKLPSSCISKDGSSEEQLHVLPVQTQTWKSHIGHAGMEVILLNQSCYAQSILFPSSSDCI